MSASKVASGPAVVLAAMLGAFLLNPTEKMVGVVQIAASVVASALVLGSLHMIQPWLKQA